MTLASIPNTGVTFAKLIQLASESYTQTQSVHLRGSLVNNNLVTTALTPNVADTFGDFSNELIHYVVLQTPVISITTGSPATFSMIASAMGNYAWWPTINDAFANKLSSVTTDPLADHNESVLSNHTVSPLLDVSTNWSLSDLLPSNNTVSKLKDFANSLSTSFTTAASMVSPFMSLLRKAGDPSGPNAPAETLEKALLIRTLDDLLENIAQPNVYSLHDPLLQLHLAITNIYEQIVTYPGNTIPTYYFGPSPSLEPAPKAEILKSP